jgi:hypothetical protein
MSPVIRAAAVPLVTCVALLAGCCEEPEAPGEGGPVEDIEDPWLLAIDEDEGTRDALIQISVEPGSEGEVTVVCEDLELPAGFPADTNFTALVDLGGTLYASAQRDTWGDTLVEIDACACTVREVGAYGFTLVSGLGTNVDGTLIGLAAEGELLIEIDPSSANSEELGALSEDWGSNGLSSADPQTSLLYGINATSDRLHRLHSDGSEFDSLPLSEDFAAVGTEFHLGRGLLYACGVLGRETSLFVVDHRTGAVSLAAESVFTSACDNLAAPAGPIACVH